MIADWVVIAFLVFFVIILGAAMAFGVMAARENNLRFKLHVLSTTGIDPGFTKSELKRLGREEL